MEKRLSHWPHENVFFHVCTLPCIIDLILWEKTLITLISIIYEKIKEGGLQNCHFAVETRWNTPLATLVYFFTSVSHYMSVSVKESLGPLAILICLFTSMSTYVFLRSEVLEEVLSHWLHWCGLSPVWVIICVLRLLVWENASSQWAHWFGFSIVWVLICLLSVPALVKALPHLQHWCVFFYQCESSYVFKDYQRERKP